MSNRFLYSNKKSSFLICYYNKETVRIQIYFQEVTIYSTDLNPLLLLISLYSNQDLKYVV